MRAGILDLMTMDGHEQNRKDRREALVKEYSEIASTFRTLTDIRFRLLSLIPIAAVATALLSSPSASSVAPSSAGTPLGKLPLALFGLAVTLSLITYNKRNDQLYDELVGRAAAIERELGVPDGAFANRPASWLTFGIWPLRWPINHRRAVSAVYTVTVSLWLFLSLEGISNATGKEWPEWLAQLLQYDYGSYKTRLGTLGSAPASAACALLLTVFGAWLLALQEGHREKHVRSCIEEAFKLIVKKEKEMIREGYRTDDENVVNDTWMSSFTPSGAVLSLSCENTQKLARLCAGANASLGDPEDPESRIRKRIGFYSGLDAPGMQRYVLPQPGGMRAAQVIALLTDLPPRWIYDMSTGRR